MLRAYPTGLIDSIQYNGYAAKELGLQSHTNLQDDGLVAFEKHYPPPDEAGAEVTWAYTKMVHDVGETDFTYWLYGEITNDQSIVAGSLMKIIHFGLGDAFYVALFADPAINPGGAGGGYGYEAAMFADAQHGFIATFQGTGPFDDVNPDQANCVGFEALVHDDGVDPTASGFAATNAGLFYGQNSLSNTFVDRMSQYANQGFPRFKLMDYEFRSIWEVFGTGIMRISSDEATSGTQNQPAAPIQFRNFYWDGADEDFRDVVLQPNILEAPTAKVQLLFQMGESGSEDLLGFIDEQDGWNFQDYDLAAVGSITMWGSGSGIDMQVSALSNVGNFTMNGASTFDLQGVQALNVGAIVPLATTACSIGHHRDVVPTVHEPSDTTQTLDWDAGNTQIVDLDSASGNVTLTLNNGEQGGRYRVIVRQGTVTRNLVWPASVWWPGGAAPTITSGLGATDVIDLVFDGTNYLAVVYGQDFQ